jgi:4-amino-4-deoxy-L-arabinose transferase-like glycosyltransferase
LENSYGAGPHVAIQHDRTLWYAAIISALPVAVCAAFLLFGVIGHDPWKADEPYCIGIVHNFLLGGDWLVPRVGPDPFLEKPPLMYWSAAALVRLLSLTLPFIEAARLVAAMWMAIAGVAVALAARAMYGPGRAWTAVLLFFGTVGLWQHAHKLVPDVSQLAGASIALAAIVLFATRSLGAARAGLIAGTGVGIAFLSKGLLIPGVFGVLALALPLESSLGSTARVRRTRRAPMAHRVADTAVSAVPRAVHNVAVG